MLVRSGLLELSAPKIAEEVLSAAREAGTIRWREEWEAALALLRRVMKSSPIVPVQVAWDVAAFLSEHSNTQEGER